MKGVSSIGTSSRPPVVVVLGHVDHGKTTLLDHIRETSVAQSETGGITQGIGASVITTKEGKKITFIDTPGHAAFSQMRAQGAKVADIAVLVVAADDGVKPQTKEALEYILSTNLAFIVAATKMDLPHASLEMVGSQLEKEGVLFEGKGGDVPIVPVSAKESKGIDELLELITLLADIKGVEGATWEDLEAFVIETGKDKRGPFTSLIVKRGKVGVGDEVVTQTSRARVRGIFDFQGRGVKEVGPGTPAQILGFSSLPAIGSRVWRRKNENLMPQTTEVKPIRKKVGKDEHPIVVKAANTGSLEAVLKGVSQKAAVIFSGIGEVSESDIFMAKPANADIYVFSGKVSDPVKKLAETEGVNIYSYDVIYELFEDLDKRIKEEEVEILGKAVILQVFPFDNKKVAGCKVVEGKISKPDSLELTREEKILGEVRIVSFKKGKTEILEAKQGEECGIIFTPQLEFEAGDVVLSVRR